MTTVSARPDNLAAYHSRLEPVDRNLRSAANSLLRTLQTYRTRCPEFSADHTELAHTLGKHASSMEELNGWVKRVEEAFRQADRAPGPTPVGVVLSTDESVLKAANVLDLALINLDGVQSGGINPNLPTDLATLQKWLDVARAAGIDPRRYEALLQQYGMVEGSQAAKDTVTAAKANNTDGVEQATRYLDQLNHKRQNGQPLTDAEKAYLQGYYDTITPQLSEIKKWADQANCTTGAQDGMRPNLHQRETQLTSRVADGLLTLSNEVPYDQLPQPVRIIIDGDIGVVNPKYSDEGGRLPTSYPPKGDENLRRYAEFMDFMDDYASENAKPSNDLAQHLGDSAIRWKQQINVIAQNYSEHIEAANKYDAGPLDTNDAKPPSPEEWAKLFPDELSSDALGLVSRNAEYSNKWISGDHADRRALIGMNWQHGSGAAKVILAGTLPSNQPNDTVSPQDAAGGALAVVRDASADYLQLARTANTEVKAAIGVMGSAYVDSFAQDLRAAAGQPSVQ
ncbi:MAG: hypothetical protein ACRDTT_06795, partial [Pseudonocardiaceae bacterium]